MERKKILLADDNITTLNMGSYMLAFQYDTFTVPSGEKLFKLLERVKPDLILLDIDMPGMHGYEIIAKLKSGRTSRDIPVILLASKSGIDSELEGLKLGAVDYIVKPFSPPLLLKRIELHLLVESQKRALREYNRDLRSMVENRARTVIDLQNSVLKTVVDMVEHRNGITGSHVERTRRYLEILLDAMVENNLYRDEIHSWNREFLLQSSQLHDLGKISIRDSILLKPGKLTEEEFSEMKNHTTLGVKIIEKIERHVPESGFLAYAKVFAETHHEKWDGSGYPRGLSSYDIPLQGRLMAIADVYDSLISARPYKAPISHEEAAEVIIRGGGSHFDPVLTDIFRNLTGEFELAAENREVLRLTA
ncbi:MAG: response regulator [Treponema sp.]|nr:response regulator [Treponema sp.]